jgi:hypothetical protein
VCRCCCFITGVTILTGGFFVRAWQCPAAACSCWCHTVCYGNIGPDLCGRHVMYQQLCGVLWHAAMLIDWSCCLASRRLCVATYFRRQRRLPQPCDAGWCLLWFNWICCIVARCYGSLQPALWYRCAAQHAVGRSRTVSHTAFVVC